MKTLIKNLADVIGQTVEDINIYGEHAAIIFNDSALILEAREECDYFEIGICKHLSAHEQRDLGLITFEECEDIVKKGQEQQRQKDQARRFQQYIELKKEFEGG